MCYPCRKYDKALKKIENIKQKQEDRSQELSKKDQRNAEHEMRIGTLQAEKKSLLDQQKQSEQKQEQLQSEVLKRDAWIAQL